MLVPLRPARGLTCVVATAALLLAGIGPAAVAGASTPATVSTPLVQQVSSDTLPPAPTGTAETQQLGTEMETDTFSWGSTVVASFQVGRTASGYGAKAIGYSTSTDDGQTWTSGILPGLSAASPSPDPNTPNVVNQSVAYDASHGQWIIPTVGYVATGPSTFHEKTLMISRSTDGLDWSTPVRAVSTNVDKAWGVCDNTPTSPHYGTCYVAYSQLDSGDALAVVSSSDGGLTWSAPVTIPSGTSGVPATGYNTNPVVQPDGTVVVVATDVHNGADGYPLLSSVSTDGGVTWSVPSTVATVAYHSPATTPSLRAKDKPTVDVDAGGTIYAAWSDCRFHASCAADDIVFATSTDGVTWSAPTRVAVDPTTTVEDKVIPGFGVEPGTSGATAHLGTVFYAVQAGSCPTACALQAEYTESFDGGSTWSPPYVIAAPGGSPFPISDLGRAYVGTPEAPGPAMVGDYLSVSFVHGSPVTVVSLPSAAPDTSSTSTVYHQGEFALTLPVGWGGTHPRATGLSADAAATITRGGSALLSTTLTDTASGTSLAGAPVSLLGHPAAGGAFTTIGTATTSTSGVASLTVSPTADYVYEWTFAGDTSHAATTSNVQPVTVRQLSTLKQGAAVGVQYGHAATVRATLTDATSKRAIAGVAVTLQGRPATGGTFARVRTVTSTSAGAVAASVVPKVNYQYRWTWSGNAGYVGATSGNQPVSVAQTVAAKLTATRVSRRHAVKVYGTVAPAATGRTVVVQQYVNRAWHTVGGSVTIRYQRMPDGKYRTGFVLTYVGSTVGTKHLRVARSATGTNAAGYSATLTVRVD